jgi:hypothetical protein
MLMFKITPNHQRASIEHNRIDVEVLSAQDPFDNEPEKVAAFAI